MPQRHGVLLSSADRPRFRLGIRRVFDPYVDPHLRVLQGDTSTTLNRSGKIEFHFRRVVRRLVRSLGHLYQKSREWDRLLEAGALASTNPLLAFEIPEEAGIAADSVFHYLNLFIDDLARVIPFVLAAQGLRPKEPDGFARLKTMFAKGGLPASPSLSTLFAELDKKDSWWYLGFEYGVGMRQRLTHYTDVVIFEGRTKPGEPKMTSEIFLVSVGDGVKVGAFEDALEMLLTGLCEWLDRLEHELVAHLSQTLAKKGVSWNPLSEPGPTADLPESDEAPRNASHYPYLPVCT